MVVAGLIDDPVAFASADEATNPIEASDSTNTSNLFMFPPVQK
jgi:hypothetical protein